MTVELRLAGKNARGRVALVDEADLPLVQGHKWYVGLRPGNREYISRYIRTGRRQYNSLYLARAICGLALGDPRVVDHINHDTFDNRRSNLRVATQSQNLHNMLPCRSRLNSEFKGVRWVAPGKWKYRRWDAYIKLKGQSATYLGRFPSPEEAAMRYNVAARKHFGDFACLNAVEMG